ncbi:MAG: tail fiber domain-containing protein [Chitinophagales bacterium]|nr:tail fiber domain-containing protein [Chitinophagales bacterium]
MNKQITKMLTVLLLFATALVSAQAPQGFNYQAVVRDASGNLITSGTVTLNFIIHQGTASGTTVYAETQTATPNQYGQVTAVIGTGTVLSGTFSTIGWGSDNYFIETQVNGNTVSNTQFQSVPYALASRDWIRSGETLSTDPGVRRVVLNTSSNGQGTLELVSPFVTSLSVVTTGNSGCSILLERGGSAETDWMISNDADGHLGFYSAGISVQPRMTLTPDGKVGIGTSFASRFPLEIEGTAASAPMTTPGNETWFKSTGGLLTVANTGVTSNVSVYANGYFATAQGFVAHSDTRLKNITGVSNQAEDLLTLNKIQVTDYTMRDLTANNGQFKKVIAQQVKQVYPQAVMDIGAEQYVANLYQLAQSYTANGNAVTFVLPKAIEEKDKNDVVVGASVKFYMQEKADALCIKETEGKITAINGNTYTVTANEAIDATVYDKMFVYGTKVNNVLAVDYDALSTLNISATQELTRKVAALEMQNAQLQNELKLSALANASLQADVELIKAQLGLRSQVVPK